MYKVVVTPAAKLDIKESARWYNKQRSGLGKRFTAEVRLKMDSICRNPFAFSERYDDVHTAVVEIFPFLIHFRVDKKSKSASIVAVLHTSLDPKDWNQR